MRYDSHFRALVDRFIFSEDHGGPGMFLKDDADLCIIVGLLFSLFSLHEYVLCFLQPVLCLFLHMFFLYNNINISYRGVDYGNFEAVLSFRYVAL